MLPSYSRLSKQIPIKQGSILTTENNKLIAIDQEKPYNFFRKYSDPLMNPPENSEQIEENLPDINGGKIKRNKSIDTETTSKNKNKSKLSPNWSKIKSFVNRNKFQNEESLNFIQNIYLSNKNEICAHLSTVTNVDFTKNDLVEIDQNIYGRIYNITKINELILACIERNPSIDTNLSSIIKDLEFSVEIDSEIFQGIIVKIEFIKKFNHPLKFIINTNYIDTRSIKFRENYVSIKFKMDDIIRFDNQYAKVVESCLINDNCCLEILVYSLDEMFDEKHLIQENKEIRIFNKELDMTYLENVIMKPFPILSVEEIENEHLKIHDTIKFSLMYSLKTFYGIIEWIGIINDITVCIINMEDDKLSEIENDFKISNKCIIHFENLEYEDDKQLFIIPICFLMKSELKECRKLKNNITNSDTPNIEENIVKTHFICLKENSVVFKKDDILEFSAGYLYAMNNRSISMDNTLLSNCRRLSEDEYDSIYQLKRKMRIKKIKALEKEQNKSTSKRRHSSSFRKSIKLSKKDGKEADMLNSYFLLNRNNLENFKFDFSESVYKKDELLTINAFSNIHKEIHGRFNCLAKYNSDVYVCIKSNDDLRDKLKKTQICLIFDKNPFLHDFEGIIVKNEVVRKFDYELGFLEELPIVDQKTEKYGEINLNSDFKRNEIIKYIGKDKIYYARVIDAYLLNEISCLSCNWIFSKETPLYFKESAMTKVTNIKDEIKFYEGTIMAPYPQLSTKTETTHFNIGDKVEFIFKYSLIKLQGFIEWTGESNEIPAAILNLIIKEEDNIISEIETNYKINIDYIQHFENLRYEDDKQLFLIPMCFLMKSERQI